MDPTLSLILATVAFLGIHVLPSTPLRRLVAGAFGESAWLGLFSLASLAGLATAPDRPSEEAALARLFLAHAVVAGWGGIPVLWSGDELGQPNDAGWALEPGHEDDNRWAHRPRLDWDRAAGRGDLGTTQGKVFQGLAHLARVRAALPQLQGAMTELDVPHLQELAGSIRT